MPKAQTALQQKIQNHITTHKFSVAGFERNAGLKTNVVRNILRGQSKRPTGETLQAIARMMRCTVQDLLNGKFDSFADLSSSILEHPELLVKALQATLKTAETHKHTLKIKQALLIAEQVYGFSLKKNPPMVDESFVEWLFEQGA